MSLWIIIATNLSLERIQLERWWWKIVNLNRSLRTAPYLVVPNQPKRLPTENSICIQTSKTCSDDSKIEKKIFRNRPFEIEIRFQACYQTWVFLLADFFCFVVDFQMSCLYCSIFQIRYTVKTILSFANTILSYFKFCSNNNLKWLG